MSKKKITQLEKTNARLAKELLQKEHELTIESSLEKVRIIALAMKQRDDMLKICKAISNQLKLLGVKEIRNVQTAIFYKEKGTYMNYEYYTKHKKTFITETIYNKDKIHKDFARKMLMGKGEVFIRHIEGKQVKKFLHDQKKTNVFIDKFLETASSLNYYWYSLGPVALGISTYHPMTKDEQRLFHRFVHVFELAYQRYFDIENAEAQAREAQIQASLERVRAGSLAMRKSDELIQAGELLWHELRKLGIESLSSGYVVMDKEEKIGWTYAPNPATGKIHEPLGLVQTKTKEMRKVLSSWKNKEPMSIIEMDEEETIAHQTFVAENGLQKDGTNSHWITAEKLISLSPKRLSLQNFNFNEGYLMIVGGNRLNEKEIELMLRFTKVFQQTYTRFLDLQKAEEQTREAQIEAALERVRVRTMAMQKSAELSEAAYVIFQQLKMLGENPIQSTIGIMNETERVIEFSVTDWTGGGGQIDRMFKASFDEPALINKSYTAWKEKRKSIVVDLRGPELEAWLNYRNKISGTRVNQQDTSGRRVVNFAFFSKGHISFSTPEPRPKESIQLLERFATEFDMTYTRFLDLQKAEAQAREAQIEAALERVRSRSMGMRKSEELKEVIKIVYDQFVHLNINIDHAGFVVDYTPKGDWHFWIADKQDIPSKISTPYFDSVWGIAFNEAKEKGIEFFPTHLNFEDKNKFYQELLSFVPGLPEESKSFYLSCPGLAVTTALSETVSLYIENFSGIPYSDEENKILIRFGKVFQQTYTRFLDLQKAEAQVREAQIEAALERVRSRTIAMKGSNELAEVALLLFQQVKELGIEAWAAGFNIWQSDDAAYIDWITGPTGDFLEPYTVPSDCHPVTRAVRDAKKRGDDFFVSFMQGEEVKEIYELLNGFADKGQFRKIRDLGIPFPQKQYNHFVFGDQVSLMFITYEPCPDAWEIFKRFGKVFEQTYTRFLDLQKAEALTRQAIQRASVDRIRAEIASMRTTTDLERITPLIWNELTSIGVPFVRCGVFIMDEKQQQINTFLSTPEGNGVAASFHLPYTASQETMHIVSHWNRKEIYRPHWDEAAFIDFTKVLGERGAITTGEKFLVESRPNDLYLHFVPFQQGMLYVGDTKPLSTEHLQLVQALAEAFSTAYLRYEDFNKLEFAKMEIEKTLVDLKQAQSQLVQSEKMASLGELTAGIAHEIQNPLNFINNFSEVNNELIEELTAERAKPKTERDEILENEILDNIRQNLEKINNHGKRADGIVKGMLQHSRSSSGQKELTDINSLADEYLRLAYHGYRAKEKFFNAKFETDFDKGIEKINIVSQDIGRVLLNLINNAFYAVNEKRKMNHADYEPAIKIATSQSGNQVFIAVSDNGNGIPKNILDKIFQPFFTTKPTGSGTGLGLSLSYDIIKAHGGDIKIASHEGEGSEFIINLPAF